MRTQISPILSVWTITRVCSLPIMNYTAEVNSIICRSLRRTLRTMLPIASSGMSKGKCAAAQNVRYEPVRVIILSSRHWLTLHKKKLPLLCKQSQSMAPANISGILSWRNLASFPTCDFKTMRYATIDRGLLDLGDFVFG